jgi:superfamily I DNA and/or RNA helicase
VSSLHWSDAVLQVQYRFPQELAAFPSTTFYEGRLRTGTGATPPLSGSCFPWPVRDGRPFPVVFVPCATEEDTGGSSKSNAGQAQLVAHIICLLRTPENEEAGIEELGITALTPYTKQAKALRGAISSRFDVQAYTIDSFQGREDDIVIFSTVRCNVHDDIGFVEDARRLYAGVIMLVPTLTDECLSGMSHGRGRSVPSSSSVTRKR